MSFPRRPPCPRFRLGFADGARTNVLRRQGYRMSSLRRLGLIPLVALALPGAALAAPAPKPIIGCPSLVNLRMLLRDTKSDVTAAAKVLGNDGTDHLGCAILERESVAALQEHLTLNGNAYDCLTLKGTSVCHWVLAGSVTFGDLLPKARGDKARAGEKPTTPEKARK